MKKYIHRHRQSLYFAVFTLSLMYLCSVGAPDDEPLRIVIRGFVCLSIMITALVRGRLWEYKEDKNGYEK